MIPLALLVLEVGSGTKFLTNSANLILWTFFGSHKELRGASYCHQIGHWINECPFIKNNVR
jgi:hypothetical protein